MMSRETRHDCLHYESDEETCSCSCGFIGFGRNQVYDCSTNEANNEDSLETISEDCESSVFSFDIHNNNNDTDVVHVAVDHVGGSSMEAILWTLNHVVTPSTTVYLIHVFPEIRLIPSPFGKFPRSRVNAEYVNFHLTQQKCKRKLLLQEFIHLCIDSKVKVEVMVVEGDNAAKAITELIRDHDIRKLVIGINKSNLSKSMSRRRNGVADKILRNVPEICDVKIICDGNEVTDKMISSLTVAHEENESCGFVPLMRFVSNPIWLFRPRF